jgi:hypothetical protein
VAGQEHVEDGGIVDDMGTWPAGRSPSGTSRWRPSPYDPDDPEPETADWSSDPGTDEGVTSTGRLRMQLDQDQAADEGPAPEVEAQWALWGKDDEESDYRVLRCSNGTFGLKDFHGIITRYASGVMGRLPQYTACWIPADPSDQEQRAADDGNGDHSYLAVGIHEVADRDPDRSGGRARAAAGREIEYIRLFCIRYDELAKYGTTYADLVDGVREQQLGADLTSTITVKLPGSAHRSLPAPLIRLAENVAALLLTTRPVCVLGGEAATAEDRLAFIDLVMSLLPYGLRTTMSASTWASATAQDLKLRLFFSSAKRDDSGRTINVTWGQPGELDFSRAEDKAPELYLSWLRQATPGALAALFGLSRPVRFTPAEIRTMVAELPEDRPVEYTLKGLANSLRHQQGDAVTAEVQRLRRHLSRSQDAAESLVYRRQITELGLLKDHPGLHPSTKTSVYRVLLDLAFERKLSYAGYCDIADAAGHPMSKTLRSLLLKRDFTTFVPWVLVAENPPRSADEDLIESLAEQRTKATAPLAVFLRDIQAIRPQHRPAAYRIAVRYLCARAQDPRAELVRRGYLADTLEIVFPGDRKAQQRQLEAILGFVYGKSLDRRQIRELFANPKLRPTKAFEAAVARLDSSRRPGQFVAEQAAYARLRHTGDPDDVRTLQLSTRRRSRRQAADIIPRTSDTLGMVPKGTVYVGAAIFTAVILLIVYLWLTSR